MRMKASKPWFLILAVLFGAGSLWAADKPLGSWNDGQTRNAILDFVAAVTRENASTYVPAAERIAVFDHDGTLWVEQPTYTQFVFGIDRAKAVGSQHPEWKGQQLFKSAMAGDLNGLAACGVKGLVELTAAPCAGLTTDEFDRTVADWLTTARHPRFHRPYTDCVYQPMVELLQYLRTNGFKTYIVSGGSLELMRPWTERVYGVPPEQLIGTTVRTKWEMRDGQPAIVRLPEIECLNDRENKALSIQKVIGRRPIAAFGNSDGDLPMLQWTAAGSGRRFCLYVHHTDADREYAYDRNAATGKLDKGLDVALTRGWTVVDMRKDWKQVFSWDPK